MELSLYNEDTMKNIILSALLTLFVASCASNDVRTAQTSKAAPVVEKQVADKTKVKADEKKVAEADDGVRCNRRAKTGSHMKRKRCTTREERAAARKDAEDIMVHQRSQMEPQN